MDFEPHNFPAMVTSVIRSDTRLAEPLKEFFIAYARNEDLEEIWSRIDSKFHQPLRLILDDLNEIEDPVSLDQEVQVLLQAIDEALSGAEQDAAMAPESDGEEESTDAKPKAKKKARKPAAKKKAAAKKPAAGKKKAAKKKAAKKAPAAKKKKTAKAAKKKVVKKAAKPAKKKAAKKSSAGKKAKPARKKKKK